MPIIRRTAQDCFEQFRQHISPVVAATLSRKYQIHYIDSGVRRTLAFRENERAIAIPLGTRFGTLHFYLAQSLEAVPEGKRFQLRTAPYWYRLQRTNGEMEPALLRWEYDPELSPEREDCCRCHVQAATTLELNGEALDQNRAQVPTGWVTIEGVIRFLIKKLNVQPPCGRSWPGRLAASEKSFYERFISKRYRK